MVKRYLLFSGAAYFPYGGANDYQGSYGTIEECKIAFNELAIESDYKDWFNILDTKTSKIVVIYWNGEYIEENEINQPYNI